MIGPDSFKNAGERISARSGPSAANVPNGGTNAPQGSWGFTGGASNMMETGNHLASAIGKYTYMLYATLVPRDPLIVFVYLPLLFMDRIASSFICCEWHCWGQ